VLEALAPDAPRFRENGDAGDEDGEDGEESGRREVLQKELLPGFIHG